MTKVTIAIKTSRPINIPLQALLESANKREQAVWGSTEIRISRNDPSLKQIEDLFRLGVFSTLVWTTEKELFNNANYAILADRKSRLLSVIPKLKASGVKRFKTYSIP